MSPVTQLVGPEPVHVHAIDLSPFLALSVQQVALLVQSLRPEFSKYAGAIAQHHFTGGFIADATDEELSDMLKHIQVATAHRVDLRKAVATWRAHPHEAMQEIKREEKNIKAEQERLASAAKAAEAARQRLAEEKRQAEAAKAAEAERQRQAEQNRRTAAERAAILADRTCVVYKNYAYRCLFHGSSPGCQTIQSAGSDGCYNNLDHLPGWDICPNTPDAVHVCASHPWGARALIFNDGSAHHTQNSGSAAGQAVGPPSQYYTGRPNVWVHTVNPPRCFNYNEPPSRQPPPPSSSIHYAIWPSNQTCFIGQATMNYLLRRSLPE